MPSVADPAPSTPLISEDGHWRWDGTAWQPITPEPPAAPVVEAPAPSLYSPSVQFSPDHLWWWDGAAWRPTAPVRVAPVTRASLWIFAGAALVFLGSLLPWVQATDNFGLSYTTAGIATSGIYADLLSLLAVVLVLSGSLRRPPSSTLATVLLTLGVLQVALVSFTALSLASTVAALPIGSVASAGLGLGLYMSSLGAGIVLAGSFLAFTTRQAATPA